MVPTSNLTNGHSTSCGCRRAEVMAKTMKKDLVGQKFGKLAVIEETEGRAADGCIIWKCQCECGNITFSTTNLLRRQEVLSCGCLRSKGEQKINQLLFDNNICYKTQYHFKDLKDKGYLYFDFAIFDERDELLCLIEY